MGERGAGPSAGLWRVAAVLALASVYFIAARLGLMMDAVAGFATLVWPPTGIALAALLRFGYRLWPGVFLGAVAANAWAGAPLLVALGIGIGNTFEAVAGTYALRRIPGFRFSLDRIKDVVGLIVLAAALSTTISATIGVSSLSLGGIIAPPEAGETWRAWWLGDLIADLVIAPMLLVWTSTARASPERHRLLEAVALAATLVAANLLIFGGSPTVDSSGFAQAYLVFPPLIWATLRFGQRGAVSAVFLTSVIAVWGTASGNGPFVLPELHEGLFALQTFIAVAAASFLVLGASIAERRHATDQLLHAHETVAHANRAKSEFLAVMSHELRTPLNAISGYTELMELEVDGPITAKQQEYLARIQRNQRHLLSLIDDVLNFARVEADRLSFSIRNVSVSDTLTALESVMEPELRRKQLTFTCDPCDASLMARADPEKLRQILLNLLANAVKFTPSGGRITAGVDREEGRIRMWVRDTGIGIPHDQLERVFEPFVQVDHGTTRSYPGIGLGLAIARELARAMGGEVRLASTLGQGSIASVELPAA